MSWGEVNPTHAYYSGSCTSKDTEDPSWSTSFKTRSTQKTSLALEDFICVVFVPDRSIEGDFILEEIEACLTNDSIPPGIDDDDFDPKGDLLLEKLLNDDPSSPLPPKELHVEELKIIK
ncbi:hypothetical protein Tco_1044979, partial [Tanacetum coccineum]